MSLSLERCSELLGNANVRAFLRCIREGESGQDDNAYTIINGGGHFDPPPWRHPWHGISTAQGARASGAYQFLGTTWARVCDALGLGEQEFTPSNQDAGAVYLIDGRGALQAVLDGDLVKACSRLRDEWVSLPNLGLQRLQRVFLANGGTLTPGEEVAIRPSPSGDPPLQTEVSGRADSADQPQETTMVPILGALLPSIVEAIPALISVFGKGDRAKDNARAAQMVADTVIRATNAVNLQDAVEKIQTDPAAKQAATAAVLAEPAIATLMEVGGGVEAARAASARLLAEADVWWKVALNPVLLVTVMVLPLVYIIVMQLVRYMDKVSADVIAQTIGTVIGLVLGGVIGFWMGQTYQQTNRRAIDQAR